MKTIAISTEMLAPALAYVQYLCGSPVRLLVGGGDKAVIALSRPFPRGGPLKNGRSLWEFQDGFVTEEAQDDLFVDDGDFVMEFERDRDGDLIASRLAL